MNHINPSVNTRPGSQRIFYGWWIVGASFLTLGLAVGMPYFGMPFFYDYFAHPVQAGGFGWSRSVITFGLPLGTLLTLWVGPIVVHRFQPRRLILCGTALTAITLIGFGRMQGSIVVYWLLWLLYMTGNIFSGGLTHQIILSHWFIRYRGMALSLAYLGISIIGALSSRFVVKPLTERYGFRLTLQLMGLLVLSAWPLVLLIMRERPADSDLQPDGDATSPVSLPPPAAPETLMELLRQRTLWLLLTGGACTAGCVGAVSQHLKLILSDNGFTEQSLLNLVYSQTLLILLITSAASRLLVGWLADRIADQHVLTLMFLAFSSSLPFLLTAQQPRLPYFFALLFGLAMGGDFLLVALLATRLFKLSSVARVLAILLPVMTVGQTWFPYLIALLREWSGSYLVPVVTIFAIALLGRILLLMLPALTSLPKAAS